MEQLKIKLPFIKNVSKSQASPKENLYFLRCKNNITKKILVIPLHRFKSNPISQKKFRIYNLKSHSPKLLTKKHIISNNQLNFQDELMQSKLIEMNHFYGIH